MERNHQLLALCLLLGLLGYASLAAANLEPEPCSYDPECTFDIGVEPQGVAVTMPPGARICYPALSASNSAGIGGRIGWFGFLNKRPKLKAFWAPDFTSPTSVIFSGRVIWDQFQNFETVLNRSNGYAQYFPGVFAFCITNPAVNTVSVIIDATEVTF